MFLHTFVPERALFIRQTPIYRAFHVHLLTSCFDYRNRVGCGANRKRAIDRNRVGCGANRKRAIDQDRSARYNRLSSIPLQLQRLPAKQHNCIPAHPNEAVLINFNTK